MSGAEDAAIEEYYAAFEEAQKPGLDAKYYELGLPKTKQLSLSSAAIVK